MEKRSIDRLEGFVQAIPAKIEQLGCEHMRVPRSEGKWSRLQILGHLCDSAIHNLIRFIDAQHTSGRYTVTSYNQDAWVVAQRYETASVEEVLALWESVNLSILRVISSIPEESLSSSQVLLPDGEIRTLLWLVDDYVEHLNHHLRQILDVD
ncbi:DinB family protein [Paenibacillus urinalis]|uniref:DinB family protein n=1 Tax=Paenibacillus urinalis TaxID=521520 RepID=A0AAX3MTW0_9BACL|nr:MULTISPECIES: DinB family protein [Paenibacillus]WDH80521.1 DinB family protein [Paenibacillus urinalis]WDH96559.1 DinB family protein [Paenibacillus urinalis]WDI00205.1 DinB family protein [Paenibacillus urinalis]GAK40711.1 hypothetical protein TCA2_3201 [Paenibacillus sp. TCA20]